MEDGYIAVFDAGKTNKKTLIFDLQLNLIDNVSRPFPEKIENGLQVEDIEAIEEWFFDSLAGFSKKYPIRVVSIATHGVTFVGLDGKGRRSMPVISYTYEPGEDFHHRFYSIFGDPGLLQKATATSRFDCLINQAKKIYFAKETFPEKFANTRVLLNYPQYFGWLLTCKASIEPTFVGCHTYLWDFENKKWSKVAEKLGVTEMFPRKFQNPWDVLGNIVPLAAKKANLSEKTIVTVGIHDSNSSLLPYLIQSGGGFALNSTGTWCVAMHPMEDVEIKKDEIGLMVYYNLDAFFRPVKTSNFMGGLEFEKYSGLIMNLSGTNRIPPFNISIYERVTSERKQFIMPAIIRGTGQFPDSKARTVDGNKICFYADIASGKSIPEFLKDPETAYAVLNLSLAVQTRVTLERAGVKDNVMIYIEGGFRKNEAYYSLLSALFPKSEIILSSLSEATAFGAALLGKAALEGKNIMELKDDFQIELKDIKPLSIAGIDAYYESWIENARSSNIVWTKFL